MRNGTELTKRSRGRPRGFIPSQVLDRVRTVFMEKGFAAASLDELAAAAGLNRPSLYAAFGDKEQLYIAHAALLRHARRRRSRRDPGRRRARSTSGWARSIKGAIDLYTAPPHRPGCMIVGTAAVESPSHPKIAAAARALAAIEKCLERAFAASDLPRKPSAAARARMAGAILYAIAIRARLGAKAADLRAFAASMVPAICA